MYFNYKAIIATLTVGMAFLSHPSSFVGATETGKLIRAPNDEDALSHSWIVAMNELVVSSDTGEYQKNIRGEPVQTEDQLRRLAANYNGEVKTVFYNAFYGMAVTMGEDDAERMSQDPSVKYIEQDAIVREDQQSPATWGIDRIDQKHLPLDNTYDPGTADGTGVTAYILDTGILTTHNEFKDASSGQPRAVWGINTTGDNRDEDCRGHGTHVAGTVGGLVYGVAKNVNLVAVKVLNCSGSGSWTGIINGLDWVLTDATGKGILNKAVANMSLGGGVNQSVNDAVAKLVNGGVHTAVSGGNDNSLACNKTPASEPLAITVGSTTSTDARSSFSNYGTCLDIYAPGSSITAAYIGSNTATAVLSGTSMASPHVAGALAVLLSGNSLDPEGDLIGDATPGKVTNPGSGSPNLLAYIKDINIGPAPSSVPTASPVPTVSLVPSASPTDSVSPTDYPTLVPSVNPTDSVSPTVSPTDLPTETPSDSHMPSSQSNLIPISIYSNSNPGYCFAPGGSSNNELYLYQCTLPSAALFYGTPKGIIRSAVDGRCLEANPSTSNGSRVYFATCNDSASQKWKIESTTRGSLIKPEIHYPSMCLDDNGTNNYVYQWTCDTSSDQYFTVGPLATSPPTRAPTQKTRPPTRSPTSSPSSSPSDPPVATCVDPELKFKFEKPDDQGFIPKFKDCSWVSLNKEARCGVQANRISCPATCNKCDVCKNSPLQFKIEKANKTMIKDCAWVKEKSNKRCKNNQVAIACRKTCGGC